MRALVGRLLAINASIVLSLRAKMGVLSEFARYTPAIVIDVHGSTTSIFESRDAHISSTKMTTMSLLDLLDEYCIKRIAQILPMPINAPLRLICARFCAVIVKPKAITARKLLCAAAKSGHRAVCEVAFASLQIKQWTTREFDRMIYNAALGPSSSSRRGTRRMCAFACILARRCGLVVDLNQMIKGAIICNDLRLCKAAIEFEKVCRSRVFLDPSKIQIQSAEAGNKDICQWAFRFSRSRGLASIQWTILGAVRSNHPEIIDLARQWQAQNSESLNCYSIEIHLRNAARLGRREICERLQAWGLKLGAQFDYARLLMVAHGAGQTDICDLVRGWIAR